MAVSKLILECNSVCFIGSEFQQTKEGEKRSHQHKNSLLIPLNITFLAFSIFGKNRHTKLNRIPGNHSSSILKPSQRSHISIDLQHLFVVPFVLRFFHPNLVLYFTFLTQYIYLVGSTSLFFCCVCSSFVFVVFFS